ncbi:MAG: preprotein translocase subunit SecE [Patescibacteria group bacterium]
MSIIDYLKETRGELKHVSWPTKSQTMAFTVVVIVVSFVVAYFLGLFDFGFTYLVERFILGN